MSLFLEGLTIPPEPSFRKRLFSLGYATLIYQEAVKDHFTLLNFKGALNKSVSEEQFKKMMSGGTNYLELCPNTQIEDTLIKRNVNLMTHPDGAIILNVDERTVAPDDKECGEMYAGNIRRVKFWSNGEFKVFTTGLIELLSLTEDVTALLSPVDNQADRRTEIEYVTSVLAQYQIQEENPR